MIPATSVRLGELEGLTDGDSWVCLVFFLDLFDLGLFLESA